MFSGYADNISDGRIAINPEKKVWRYEVKKMQGVRLEHLAVMHQSSHFLASGGESVACPGANNNVECFGCGQVVAYGTNAAEALHQYWSFPVGPALDESFKSPELNNVEATLGNFALLINVYCDFPVSFNPGNGLYCDLFFHFNALSN
jgi:hypothetical protein